MKAAVVDAIGAKFIIHENVEIASPIGREILVDVKGSGLCHSDIHVVQEGAGISFPVVLGHEVAGIVREIGPDVTEFAVGDHVVGCLNGFCGHCDRCSAGQTYRCRNYPQGTQRSPDQPPRLRLDGRPLTQLAEIGGFAEQVLLHENNAVVVDNRIPFDKAALLGCGVTTGFGAAVNTAGVRVGDTVAVLGCGGVGLNVIQGAAFAGARRVVAIDLQRSKLELAQRFGATDLVNPTDGDAVEQVRELTDGGVDHSFEVIGLKATAEQALAMLNRGGTAYLVGAQKPGTTIDYDPNLALFDQTSLQGVWMGSSSFKHDVPMFVELYLQRRLNLDDLVSQTITLENINGGYEDLAKGEVARSVIVF